MEYRGAEPTVKMNLHRYSIRAQNDFTLPLSKKLSDRGLGYCIKQGPYLSRGLYPNSQPNMAYLILRAPLYGG